MFPQHVDTHDFWSFLAHARDGISRGDHTPAHIFGDWLMDHGDWRAKLFHTSVPQDEATDLHAQHYPTTGPGWASAPHYPGGYGLRNPQQQNYGSTQFTPLTNGEGYIAYTHHEHPADPARPLRMWSILTPEHVREMREAGMPPAHGAEAHKLARRGPIGRLWDRLTGAAAEPAGTPWHPHHDGIVHVGRGEAGVGDAYAERAAVVRALQAMSGGRQWTPNDQMRRYTELASRFVRLFPQHTVAKHYTDAIAANPGLDTASRAAAVTPLIRFLNRLQAHAGADSIIAPPVPEGRTTVAPEPTAAPDVSPWTPTIRRAASLPPIPLADLRRRTRARPEAAAPAHDDGLPPIPLADTKPTGWDRHAELTQLHEAGHTKPMLLRHLMDRYAMGPRKAAGVLTRWGKARKLARPQAPRPIPEAHLTGKAVPDRSIAGTQLAYHLRSLVAEGVKTGDHRLVNHAREALGFSPDTFKRDPAEKRYGSASPAVNALEGKRVTLGGVAGAPAASAPLDTSPYGSRVDPFAKLGALLHAKGHRLAKAYNWHTMMDSQIRDAQVERAVRRLITGHRDDHHLFTGASRTFDLGRGNKQSPQFVEFWNRLTKMMKAGGDTYSASKLNESLKRLADREEDRRELAADPDWHKQAALLPGAAYMKFRREGEEVTRG